MKSPARHIPSTISAEGGDCGIVGDPVTFGSATRDVLTFFGPMLPIEGVVTEGLAWTGRLLGLDRAAQLAATPLARFFAGGRIPRASELARWGRAQGWTVRQSRTGPMRFFDKNGVVRMELKSGSARTPGSELPHGSFRNPEGQTINPRTGEPVSRRSPENHSPIRDDMSFGDQPPGCRLVDVNRLPKCQ